MNLSLVYELLIVRKLKDQLRLPNIPHLPLRFAIAYAVGGLSCFGIWTLFYAAFGNMIPFHGFFAAVFGIVAQGVYLCWGLVPKEFYRRSEELKVTPSSTPFQILSPSNPFTHSFHKPFQSHSHPSSTLSLFNPPIYPPFVYSRTTLCSREPSVFPLTTPLSPLFHSP